MRSLASHAIKFHYVDTRVSLPEKLRIKTFLGGILKNEGYDFKSLSYIFCKDAYLLRINKKYLRHNFLTDIITFDFSDRNGPVEGEIYLSIDRVRENATNFGVTIKEELLRVMFHGVLHLCGYKDKTKADSRLMRAKEDEYLNKYFRQTVPRKTVS